MLSTWLFRLDRIIRDKATDDLLTAACLTVAGAMALIALTAPPELKAAALAWTVAP